MNMLSKTKKNIDVSVRLITLRTPKSVKNTPTHTTHVLLFKSYRFIFRPKGPTLQKQSQSKQTIKTITSPPHLTATQNFRNSKERKNENKNKNNELLQTEIRDFDNQMQPSF